MIRRLVISNYRSLGEQVSVPLGRLTALVGPNAAGKSSVIDVLRFLGELLQDGLGNALGRRNGIAGLRRRSAGPAALVTIRVELDLPEGAAAWEFGLGGHGEGDFRVAHEHVKWTPNVAWLMEQARSQGEQVLRGPTSLMKAQLWPKVKAALDSDNQREFLHRLQLSPVDLSLDENSSRTTDPLTALVVSELPTLAEPSLMLPRIGTMVYLLIASELARIGCYTIFPDSLRPPQSPDAVRRPMEERGSNWTTILRRLKRETAGRNLIAALHRIVGDITDYRVNQIGGYLAAEFCHGGDTWLDTSQESDGTLRVAGLLTALLQEPPLSLYSIEEPELTVHPGALPVLLDFMVEASQRSQILLSTHSPELLDLLDVDQLLVVERRGATSVAPVNAAQREIVKSHLLTTSDLLRAEGLQQDPAPARDEAPRG